MSEPSITLEVARYSPEEDDEPALQKYEIPYREDWVVLDALNHIKDYVDETLTYRWSCRMGVCGSCGTMVNGEPKLTCATFLRDYYPGVVTIEPLANFPVARDLIIEMDDFMEKLQAVKPWIIRDEEDEKPVSEGEYLQSPSELAEFKQFTMCINCMLCYSACPVYGLEESFVGPAALALAHRYNLDSRDKGNDGAHPRRGLERGDLGVYVCRRVFGRLSETRRSGRRHSAHESGDHKRLVQIHPHAVGQQLMSERREPRSYHPTISPMWWLKKRRFFMFMMRELSSVFVAAFVLLFMYELFLVSKGPETLGLFQESIRRPAFLIFYVIAFVFAVYHTITWFGVLSKIQVVRLGPWTVPPFLVTASAFGGWFVVSAAVAWYFVK